MSDESRTRAFLRTVGMVLWDPAHVARETRVSTAHQDRQINRFRWICIAIAVVSFALMLLLLNLIGLVWLIPALVTGLAMITKPVQIMADVPTDPEVSESRQCLVAASLVLLALLPAGLAIVLLAVGRSDLIFHEEAIMALFGLFGLTILAIFVSHVRFYVHLSDGRWGNPLWVTMICLFVWWVAAVFAAFVLIATGFFVMVVVAVLT